MADLHFERALVSGRWAHDVRITLAGDGSIAGVDEGVAAPRSAAPRGVAVPGVPNVHSHAFQRALSGLTERGSAQGDSFWSWRERMFRFLEKLGPEDVHRIAAQLYVELLRHGFTSVVEFHYLRNAPGGARYADPVEMARRTLDAAEMTGMGRTLLPTLYRTADFGGGALRGGQRRFAATVDEILADVATLSSECSVRGGRVGLALHSLRAVPPDELSRALGAALALDPELPIHIHVAEQQREVEGCIAWSGARPVQWLFDHAPVDRRWCLVHATHVEPREIQRMAASGAVVGLCPTTEANLGDGLFPFAEYLTEAGRFAVGTDAHVGVSPVGELRMLEYGQRLARRARNVAAGRSDRSSGRVLLDGVLAGGAAAAGRPIGVLAAGARADLVVLDPSHPVLAGRSADEVVDSWVFSGDDTPVRDVMVGGRWVVRDGRHVHEEEILEGFRATVARLAE